MNYGHSLKVAVVEDDVELRAGFADIVGKAPAMTCVGTFPSAESAIEGLASLAPDVVLMDIGLPKMTGIECVRRLKPDLSATYFVMLTTFSDSDSVFESLQAGATGYLVKGAPPDEIVGAIHDVASGGAPMSAAIARKVVQYFARPQPSANGLPPNPGERAVLDSLAQGRKHQEVADGLGLTLNAVRTCIRSIYEKLYASSRAQA